VCIDEDDGDALAAAMAAAATEGWDMADAGLAASGDWQPFATGSPVAVSPRSPLPSGQQQQEQQQQPGQQHQLVFPERSAAVLRWNACGKLFIAPPPALEALLAAVAAAAPGVAPAGVGVQQQVTGDAQAEAEECPSGPVAVQTPLPTQQQQTLLLPPVLAARGLLVQQHQSQPPGSGASRQLVSFDAPAAHRWTFMAAIGAQQQQEEEDQLQQQRAADATPQVQQGATAAEGPTVAAAAPGEAPAAVPASKKAGKAAKPRKRKPAVAVAPDAPAAVAAAAAAAEGAADAEAPPKAKRRMVRVNE
jgi:hypothetical protein